MEVNELITALIVCADDDIICPACERYDNDECDGTWEGPASLMVEAAQALEEQRKRIAELEAEKRWIPVTERLPQEGLHPGTLCETVQVLLMNGSVTVGYCNRGMKLWFYLPVRKTEFVGHGYDLTPVIAWKPLSKLPEEGT